MKPSEKIQVSLQRDLTSHRNGAFRPVLASVYWSHPCSERCSYPFSDSFLTAFSEVRYELATLSNGKDSSFRGCALLSGRYMLFVACTHRGVGCGVNPIFRTAPIVNF